MQRKNNQPKIVFSKNVSKWRVAVVVADFNADIMGGLLRGAEQWLTKAGIKHTDVVHVPGAFEIPLACQRLAKTKKYDGIVALGAVIKGGTDHYYYICSEVSRGVMRVMLDESLPVAFGVITVSSLKQAKDRSGVKNNKGEEAVQALLHMIGNIAK